MFVLAEAETQGAIIKVVGVGGGGGNAVTHMVNSGIEGVDFICINTDAQALKHSKVKTSLQIGCNITKGLGAGADPEVGRQAAMEDRDRIIELIEGCDMLFITAGMGGGTGTGAAPVVAAVAKELGILTVAVVTKPFDMEGGKRMLVASAKATDRLVVYDGDSGRRLRTVGGPGDGPGQLSRPNGVATVDDRYLFVVERDNRRVQMFSLPDFAPLLSFGQDGLQQPYGLWVRHRGQGYEVLVSDAYMAGEDAKGDDIVPPLDQLDRRFRRYEVHALSHLALIASLTGDNDRALALGEEALAVARPAGQLRSEAYAHLALGHAYLGLGRLDEAAAAYRQSASIRQEIGQPHLAVESVAGSARVELARGDIAAALAHVEEILALLRSAWPECLRRSPAP